MDNVIFSLILSIPVFFSPPPVCRIVDVLSSDFLYGTALSVLTYTLITQTARNPLLAPLPISFSPPCLCVFVWVYACVFVWLNVPVYTLELDRDGRRVLLYMQWSRTVWICAHGCVFWELEKITHSRLLWIRPELLSCIVWTVSRGLSSGLVTSAAGGKVGRCRSSWSV